MVKPYMNCSAYHKLSSLNYAQTMCSFMVNWISEVKPAIESVAGVIRMHVSLGIMFPAHVSLGIHVFPHTYH